MHIPVDFSHKITVEELDTGKKAVFLVVRGTSDKVRVPADADEIEDMLPPAPEEIEDSVVRTVQHSDPKDDSVGMSAPVKGLTPGKLSGPATPEDAFGAHEG